MKYRIIKKSEFFYVQYTQKFYSWFGRDMEWIHYQDKKTENPLQFITQIEAQAFIDMVRQPTEDEIIL